MSFSQKDILNAADAGNVNLMAAHYDSRWCIILRELVDFLNALADSTSRWKFWVKPGLRVAAFALGQLRGLKCND